MAIRSAAKLWQALSKEAGLDLKRYDEQLVVELAGRLKIPAKRFPHQLEQHGITIEAFVQAFVRVIQPYGGMMQEILEFFAKIDAATSGNSLNIRFDFEKLGKDFDFDLENFRDWERHFTEGVRRLRQDELDELQWGQIRAAFIEPGITYRIEQGRHVEVLPGDAAVAKWLRKTPIGAPRILRPPLFRGSKLQALVTRVWMALPQMSPDDTRTVVRGAYLLKNHEATLQQRLEDIFRDVRSLDVEVRGQIELLRELLRLPVWKRRSEVYSIWVGVRLIEALGPRMRVHVVDRAIVFAFGGAHLATLALPSGENLQVWCERRTRAEKIVGKGRKHNIQPDYSVLCEPISHPRSAALIVECKQYLQQSRRSFVTTLIDYTNGHPNALVMLASYGPANEGIIADLKKHPGQLDARAEVVGMLRPRSEEAIARFESAIRSILPTDAPRSSENVIASPPTVAPRTSAAAVVAPGCTTEGSLRISWEGDADLDLHCWLSDASGEMQHIYYRRTTASLGGSNASLDRDAQAGGLSETLTWRLAGGAAVQIAVHAYAGNLSTAKPQVEAMTNGQRWTVECPKTVVEPWWLLVRLEESGTLMHLINSTGIKHDLPLD